MKPNEKPTNSDIPYVGNRIYLPPEKDEIEVSLFGPGYGESVLLHIGANQWIIVDSCIDPVSGYPAPLSYLRKNNINPGVAVKQIIATHWHDDHIRGLSAILKECKAAEFVCSGALTSKEFLTLVAAYGVRSMMDTTGVNEFYEIIKLLQGKDNNKNNQFIPPKFAFADRHLWQYEVDYNGLHQPCIVYTLSPSDASILLAQMGIADLLPQVGETKRRIPALGPNHAAVVLLVMIGDDSIILGSDIEETGNLRTGWTAIINSVTRPKRKSSFFKVSHHGALSGDNPQIWDLILQPRPVSALTPFASGKVFLPTRTDVVRILDNTEEAYLTGMPKLIKPKKRAKMVEKQLKEIGAQVRPVYSSTGHIRVRGRYINNKIEWKIDLFNGALHLKNILN